MQYYKNIAEGKVNSYTTNRSTNQRGGSISGKANDFMIAIDDGQNEKETPSKTLNVSLVSPSQQTVDQAKSEINHEKTLKRKNHSVSYHSAKKPRGVKTKAKLHMKFSSKKRKSPKGKNKKPKSSKPTKQKSSRKQRATKKTHKKQGKSKKQSPFASWLQ